MSEPEGSGRTRDNLRQMLARLRRERLRPDTQGEGPPGSWPGGIVKSARPAAFTLL